jgi:hypothetical protein
LQSKIILVASSTGLEGVEEWALEHHFDLVTYRADEYDDEEKVKNFINDGVDAIVEESIVHEFDIVKMQSLSARQVLQALQCTIWSNLKRHNIESKGFNADTNGSIYSSTFQSPEDENKEKEDFDLISTSTIESLKFTQNNDQTGSLFPSKMVIADVITGDDFGNKTKVTDAQQIDVLMKDMEDVIEKVKRACITAKKEGISDEERRETAARTALLLFEKFAAELGEDGDED